MRSKTIPELQNEIHQNAINKGFWEGEMNIGEKLMLIDSEVSEALEADRKGHWSEWVNGVEPIAMASQLDDELYKEVFEKAVKNTFEDELADAVIRIFDLTAQFRINLEWHIQAKMRYNSLRPYKHGKKY